MFLLRTFGLFNKAMSAANNKLVGEGMPPYYLGKGKYNTEYKTDVRFLANFPPKFLLLIDHIPSGKSFEVEVF